MSGTIYRVHGLWHLESAKTHEWSGYRVGFKRQTKCRCDMATGLEQRTIGNNGRDKPLPDPAPAEMCPFCFPTINKKKP